MHVLEYPLNVLTILGYSRPSSWTSPLNKALYMVYRVFAFLTIHALLITQMLDLVLVVENQDDFSENLYMTGVMIVTCMKMFGLVTMRKNIDTLCKTLDEEPFRPVDAEEAEIRTRFDKTAA